MHDICEEYSVWRCYEIGSPPFYCDLLISMYLALLQIVGIVLALQTRKVKICVLSDSKFVAALVYISSSHCAHYIHSEKLQYINVIAAIFSGGIITLATFFLTLMFIPKVRHTLYIA